MRNGYYQRQAKKLFDSEGNAITTTPWGEPQEIENVAEGIDFVSTAGHGGYLLNASRHNKVRELIPGWTTFAGGRWYEEDCDAAVVVVCHPECFPPESVERAFRAVITIGSRSRIEEDYDRASGYTGWKRYAAAAKYAAGVPHGWRTVETSVD